MLQLFANEVMIRLIKYGSNFLITLRIEKKILTYLIENLIPIWLPHKPLLVYVKINVQTPTITEEKVRQN